MAGTVFAPTTTISDRIWSVEDLDRLPQGFRYEIVDGVLYMGAPPVWPHSGVIANLSDLLSPWVRTRRLGRILHPQTGLHVGERDYVDPDLLYLRPDQLPVTGQLPRTAALAVEVLSPSSRRAAREDREALLRRAGVEELWYVDTAARTLEVRRPEGDGYRTACLFQGEETVTTGLLPGLEFPLSALWEDLDP